MAEAGTTPAPADAKGAAPSAPRRVDAERVPGLDVTADPRWALGFLAKLYAKAKEQKVLNTLPGWIEPDSRSLKTVVNPSRNATFADRTARTMAVEAVVSDLIKAHELPASTSKDTKALNALFERETVLGTALLERTAVNWMQAKLAAQRAKVLQIVIDANQMPLVLTQAAARVVARVADTAASVRDDDLYRVMYPKNRRAWRDGSTMERVTHLRYISAVRKCAEELVAQTSTLREVRTDPGSEIRGLESENRGRSPVSNKPAERNNPADAYRLLGLMVWHPKAVALVDAWKRGPADGIERLAEVVNESVRAIDKLAGKLKDDPSMVWRFPAALRGSIEALNVIEKDALTYYALVWAQAVKPALDTALEVIGNVVSLLELYGGPLALVAAVADAILQAAGTAISVLRQLDQDHAETATEFEKEADRLSTGGRYGGALGQGASALLAATAVPGALRKLAGAARKEQALVPKPSAGVKGTDPGARLAERRGTSEPALGRPASGEIPKAKPNPITTGRTAGTPTPESVALASSGRRRRPPADAEALAAQERGTGRIDITDEERAVGEAQGMRIERKPPVSKAPPGGATTGPLGESREWIASGLVEEPATYKKVVSSEMHDKLDKELKSAVQAGQQRRRQAPAAQTVDETLRNYVNRFESATNMPVEQIRDVPFWVWMQPPYGPKGRGGALERRFDRVIRLPDRKVLLRETKAYTKSALDYHRSLKLEKQLDIDIEILNQYPYANMEYRLDGKVLDTTMRELEALESRFAGRFKITRAPNWEEVAAAQAGKAAQ